MLALIELHDETGVRNPEITASQFFCLYEISNAESALFFQGRSHISQSGIDRSSLVGTQVGAPIKPMIRPTTSIDTLPRVREPAFCIRDTAPNGLWAVSKLSS